jgi:Flp pilus assembly protein TadD
MYENFSMLPAMMIMLLWPASPAGEAYARGVALIEQGRPDLAVEHLQSAAAASPANAQYRKALGVSLAMQKRYAEADEPFRRACELQPALADACYFYARNLYALDRYEPSLAVLQKLTAADPRPWRIWLGIAQAEQALARAPEAEKAFRTAIRLHTESPPSEDPRVHFGSFLFREGRLDEAAATLKQLCEARPNSARGFLELGRVEMQLGRLEAAEQHLRRALDLGAGEPSQLLLDRVRARLQR